MMTCKHNALQSAPDYDLYSAYTKRMLPFYLLMTERAVVSEVFAQMARAALALERYYLAEGSYPETLSSLVPEYPPSIPIDLFDGNPLRFAPTADGRFHLYSIGWNLRDDGATMPVPQNYSRGDLSWGYEVAVPEPVNE